jgi:hypothetical protein
MGVPFDSVRRLEFEAVLVYEDIAGALDFDGFARVIPAERTGGDIGDFLQ